MNDTTRLWKLDKQIPSHPDDGVGVIREVLEQLEKNGWGDKDIFGVHMAMEEAVMNAIKHGNKRDPSKSVRVQITLTGSQFYACVTDQGEGFDPQSVPDPTLDENLEKACGRGLMLMTNFVDVVKYNELGNSVELTRKKSEPVC